MEILTTGLGSCVLLAIVGAYLMRDFTKGLFVKIYCKHCQERIKHTEHGHASVGKLVNPDYGNAYQCAVTGEAHEAR